jgi:tetratricopeptide (TPR) repeat protein
VLAALLAPPRAPGQTGGQTGQTGVPTGGAFLEKLKRTDPTDPGALLAAGKECETEGRPAWAMKFYLMALKLGGAGGPGGEERVEAMYRLARLEVERKLFDDAFPRLLELAGKHRHVEARSLLETIQSQKTREQLSHLEKGDELFASKRHEEALTSYEKAYALASGEARGAATVPAKVILKKLAAARNEIDNAFYESRVAPVKRSIKTCSGCGAKRFVTCSRCNGEKGRWIDVRLGRISQKRFEPCPTCNRRGYVGCGACVGLGAVSDVITAEEKNAILKVVNRVRHPQVFAKPFDGALREVEEILLETKSGSTLNYLRSIEAKAALSPPLEKALESVPPRDTARDAAAAEWGKETTDPRARIGFLMSYATEFARHIHHFDMLRASARPAPGPPLGPAAAAGSDGLDALSPELLSAFPDAGSGGWMVVRGRLKGYDDKKREHKGFLDVRGEIGHDVKFFVWLPSAREHLERLEKGPWRARLSGLVERYPFDLDGRLEAAPADHQVALVGRFLRDRLDFPRSWFEVWAVDVGLSPVQHAMHLALAERIDEIAFPGIPAREVARILKSWFDLEIRFEGVGDEKPVDLSARDCALGLLVDHFARVSLGASWRYDEGAVVVTRTAPQAAGEDVRVVLARLRESGAGDFGAGGGELGAEAGPAVAADGAAPAARAAAAPPRAAEPLPEDPVGLRVRSRDAVLAMRYAEASECLDRLLEMTRDPRRAGQIRRLRMKYELFDELTGRLPVSHLAGAPRLAEIVYEKPSGELVPPTTVRILRREADSLLIQEAYGARFTVKTAQVKREREVSASAWLEGKKKDLARMEAELAGAPPEDRARKLFLLALFAKTNRFLEEGARALERASGEEGFEWILTSFHPERAEALTRLWRLATGRAPGGGGAPAAAGGAAEQAPGAPEAPPSPAPEIAAIEPAPADVEALHAYAKKLAREGSACFRRTLEGEGASGWRQLAIARFEAARQALERYLESHPGHPEASRLKLDLVQMIQTCSKDLGFFD